MNTVISGSFYKSIDYDEVRKAGGFAAPSMLVVSRISASKTPLSEEEKATILTSKTLSNVHTFDLSNQGIMDQFIENFSQCPCFARIINLDLSGNPAITEKALEHLLESDIIGSMRDLPQVSARYGCASTTIYVKAEGTGIKKQPEAPAFGFSISYQDPITGRQNHETVEHAVKFLDVSLRP